MPSDLLTPCLRTLQAADFSAKQAYSALRAFLADVWLAQQGPNPYRSTHIPSVPFVRPDVQAKLHQLLTHWPAAPEGTPNALTPEIISQIGERENGKSAGTVYTPFQTARQLARDTLCAWLKLHHFLPPDTLALAPQHIPADKRQAAAKALRQLTVCDPACGAGGLLIPFMLELAALRHGLTPSEKYGSILAHIAACNLYGADINPQAVADFRLRLTLTLAAHRQALPGPLHLFVMDALAGHPHTIWRKKCPQIFARGGFDIYLANPPYIGQKNHKDIFNTLRQNPRWEKWLTPKSDLLYLFFHLAFELTRPDGTAGLLTTSYYAQAAAARPLRVRLREQATLLRLLDFGEEKLFKRAQGQHNLMTVFTPKQTDAMPCLCGPDYAPQMPQHLFFGPHVFLITRPPKTALRTALAKMAAIPHKLQEAAHICNGLMTGCDQAFVLPADTVKTLSPNAAERRKLKPFYKNSDISAYTAARTPRYYLIDLFYPKDRATDMAQYPHLALHLARFKTKLLARKQNNNGIQHALKEGKYWFGSVRRRINFDGEKLVIPHRARSNMAAYTNGPWYASSDVYFITQPQPGISLWYLLALFNSAPCYTWLFYNGKRKGNLLELYSEPLGNIPIPLPSANVQHKLEQLAKAIYTARQKNPQVDISAQQTAINRIVCKLFGLSAEEIQAVNAETTV